MRRRAARGAAAASRSSGAASRPRLRRRPAGRASAPAVPLRSSSGPARRSRGAASPRRTRRPRYLACAAARARRARRAGRRVSSVARSRNAPSRRTPPRAWARSAERSSSAATSSSGPAAAWARCQARRSGSLSGSVASASARWRRGVRRVRRRGRRPSGPADGGIAPWRRTRSGWRPRRPAAAPSPMPRRRAARHSTAASPSGSAAAASSRRCVSAGARARAAGSSARSGVASRRVSGSAKPPRELGRVSPRGSSSRASGLPPVSATMRSATRASRRPGTTDASNARASCCAEPVDVQLGEPRQQIGRRRSRGRRRPSRRARPAGGARRTPASAPRPGPATARRRRRRQGLVVGDRGQQAQHGQPDEERSGGAARAQAERGGEGVALRARAGRPGGPAAARTAGAGREGELHLRIRRPQRRATRHPAARPARWSSSAVLPTPASPRSTRTRLCPARMEPTRRSNVSHSARLPIRARRRITAGHGPPRNCLSVLRPYRTTWVARWGIREGQPRPGRVRRAARPARTCRNR